MRHKSAISITLDDDILKFFSGKGRSGKINHILRLYLRSKLGDDDDSRFEDKTHLQHFMPAVAVCQKQFGDDSPIVAMLLELRKSMEGWIG